MTNLDTIVAVYNEGSGPDPDQAARGSRRGGLGRDRSGRRGG